MIRHRIEFSGPKNAFPEKMIDRMIELDKHGDFPDYVSKKVEISGNTKRAFYRYANDKQAAKAIKAFRQLADMLNEDHAPVKSIVGEREEHYCLYYVYIPSPNVSTVSEVAKKFDCSDRAVRHWITSGKLEAYLDEPMNRNGNPCYYISNDSVEALYKSYKKYHKKKKEVKA